MGFAPDAHVLYSPNIQLFEATAKIEMATIVADVHAKDGQQIEEVSRRSGGAVPLFTGYRSSFFPAMANTPRGPVVLAYCRATETTVTDVCLSVLNHEGQRRIIQLNSASTEWSKTPGDKAAAPIQRNFGDYISVAASGDYVVAAWTDARNGAPRIMSRVVLMQ